MFVEQLRRAVEASPRAELPAVSALLWKAYAAGHVTEAEASALSEAIELKRALPLAPKPVQRRRLIPRPQAMLIRTCSMAQNRGVRAGATSLAGHRLSSTLTLFCSARWRLRYKGGGRTRHLLPPQSE